MLDFNQAAEIPGFHKPGMNAEQITPQSAGKMPKGFFRYLTTRG
jgi:hypothetical protein